MQAEDGSEAKKDAVVQHEAERALFFARAPRLAPNQQPDTLGEINTFLEPRSRQLTGTIRLMEQQRYHYKNIDGEREATMAKISQAFEALREAQRATQAVAEKEVKIELAEAAFERHRKVLEELENAVAVAHTNFLCWRLAWEQFVQTREKAKALRAELSTSPSY
jgi:hypothetical protein